MQLTRHQTPVGIRWALDGRQLPKEFSLDLLLQLSRKEVPEFLGKQRLGDAIAEGLLAPLEADHEVWASGVTYLRSRDARTAESDTKDVYERVYDAERPELFFKSLGWRTSGPGAAIRIRRDAKWNVPEPELALVINRYLEVVGYSVGNDMSSRDIEGENPLYLPQAKVFDGSCALGPAIALAEDGDLVDLPIELAITRNGELVFSGETRTAQIKRRFSELAGFLGRELSFPKGVFLMTGTGIVPPDDFSLRVGDLVRIRVGELKLENPVQS